VPEVLTTLQNLFTLAFVITSMFAVGLSLTVPQIVAPLKIARLVVIALVVSFILVPAVAFILSKIIPMGKDLQIGLLLFGTSAGAPFLPRLSLIAEANVACAVGVMVLLIVVTVIYLPIVLPLLLPLAVGLIIRARYEEATAGLQPHIAQISNVSLVLLLVLMLATNIKGVPSLFGKGAIIATLITLAVAIVGGYFLGGPGVENQQVMALGAGHRTGERGRSRRRGRARDAVIPIAPIRWSLATGRVQKRLST
jgi:BASS family bile acid:Na+ symporter